MLLPLLVRRSLNHLRPQLTVWQANQLAAKPLVTLTARGFTVCTLNQCNILNKYNDLNTITLQRRSKKKKASKVEQRADSDDEDSDSDEEVVDDEVVGIGYVDRDIEVHSNRFDVVFKNASRCLRAALDTAFFENRIRVNGYTLTKKSEMASTGDVIDMIKGRNAENTENLDVVRVEILNVPDKGTNAGRIKMKVRLFRTMTIENYAEDPYEGSYICTPDDKSSKE